MRLERFSGFVVALAVLAAPCAAFAGGYGHYPGHKAPSIGFQYQSKHGSIGYRVPLSQRHRVTRSRSYLGRGGTVIIDRRDLWGHGRGRGGYARGFKDGYRQGLRQGIRRGLGQRGGIRYAPRAPGWHRGRSSRR